MKKHKIFLIIQSILVCFVLVFLTLGIFFYGLLVNLGIIPTVELEYYEVSGFIIMGMGMWFTLFLLSSFKSRTKVPEEENV